MDDNSKVKEDNNGYSEGILLRDEGSPTVSKVTTTGVNQIDSLLSGLKWGNNNLTFSFPTSASQYTGYSSDEEPYSNFVGLNSMQQNAARNALAAWASICNLTFTETTGGNGTILFGTSSLPPTSLAYYPSTGAWGGDIWFGNSTSNSPDNPVIGSYDYATYIHEIGHALGLKHPHDTKGSSVVASSDFDSIEYSIMSYRSYVGADLDGYTVQNGSYPTGLMMSDIAAIQNMYGANYNYNAGNTVYKFDPNHSTIFETIWDGGGNDTYDLSAYTINLKIDLRPGEWSTFDTNQLSYLGDGHYAKGNVANALLYNGDTRSLIDNAVGGSGNDVILGNDVENYLVGGAGNDFMDGGGGFNTGGYYGQLSDFFVVHDVQGHLLVSDCTGVEGNDFLVNFQQLQFSNKSIDKSYEYFDGLRYIASYSDLINAFGTNQNAAKTQFINNGFQEGRKANFNGLSYIASYADLIKVFGTDQTAATTQFINYGYKEGRRATFDALAYTASYADLIKVFGTDQTAAATQFINYGYREGRKATFNALAYTASYSDLMKAYGTDQTAAATQFINYGYKEGRKTTFNALEYTASYSDLMKAYGTDQTAAATQFINYGYKEGRKTTFNALAYTASYSDLIKAYGTDQTAAATQFINYGYKEGRKATFNVNQYLANYADLRDVFGSDTVAATKHYIQYGSREGRTDKSFSVGGNVQTIENISSSALYASNNNSLLFGTTGTEIVNSSAGNTSLYGSGGYDYFDFNPSSEMETIVNDNAQNIVHLGDGFTANNLTISQNSNKLLLNASNSDILTIAGEITNLSSVNHFQFADGTNYKVQNGHFE